MGELILLHQLLLLRLTTPKYTFVGWKVNTNYSVSAGVCTYVLNEWIYGLRKRGLLLNQPKNIRWGLGNKSTAPTLCTHNKYIERWSAKLRIISWLNGLRCQSKGMGKSGKGYTTQSNKPLISPFPTHIRAESFLANLVLHSTQDEPILLFTNVLSAFLK